MLFLLHIYAALLCGFFASARGAGAFANETQCGPQALPQHIFIRAATCAPNRDLYAENKEERDRTWRSAPRCFRGRDREYCAHAIKDYGAGRGLSIISTPEAARAALASRKHAQRPEDSPRRTWFQVHDIPGKGQGVIAQRLIPKGTIIMLDPAGLLASAQLPAHIAPAEGTLLLNAALQILAPYDRDAILALDGHGSPDIQHILQTNSFNCRFDDGGTGDAYFCLFPLVSRINHACRPNANAKFRHATLAMEIRALRDIAPGEEISISYGKVELMYAERQKLYRDNWKFTCTCELCTAGEVAVAQSDRRRERFGELHSKLDALTVETYDLQKVAAWEAEVLGIAEEEGFQVLVTMDMERMAYLDLGAGNRLGAVSWARMAKRNLLMWTLEPGGTNDDLNRIEELLSELGED